MDLASPFRFPPPNGLRGLRGEVFVIPLHTHDNFIRWFYLFDHFKDRW